MKDNWVIYDHFMKIAIVKLNQYYMNSKNVAARFTINIPFPYIHILLTDKIKEIIIIYILSWNQITLEPRQAIKIPFHQKVILITSSWNILFQHRKIHYNIILSVFKAQAILIFLRGPFLGQIPCQIIIKRIFF